jgi:hypothetical protein
MTAFTILVRTRAFANGIVTPPLAPRLRSYL